MNVSQKGHTGFMNVDTNSFGLNLAVICANKIKSSHRVHA